MAQKPSYTLERNFVDEKPTLEDGNGVLNRRYTVVFRSLLDNGWYSAAPNDKGVPRSIRTNNAGGLNITEWQKRRPGYVDFTTADARGNRTTIYCTPEHGVASWYHLLSEIYGFSRASTFDLLQLATRYSGGDECLIKEYMDGWHRWSGGALNSEEKFRLNDLDSIVELAVAMFSHEAGQRTPLHRSQIMYAIKSEYDGVLQNESKKILSSVEAAQNRDASRLRQLAHDYKIEQKIVERLIEFRDTNRPSSAPRYWAVLDFNRISVERRLFVFDVEENGMDSYYCAHGKGSEGILNDGYATVFSNRAGSNASSLGIYLCEDEYFGENGYSLRLDGMESTNSNAKRRSIVIHGADYVSEKFISENGYLGRSWGCVAVERELVGNLVNQLRNGSLLLAWRD